MSVEIKMPAGFYWIGDPCLVFKTDESWKLFCDEMHKSKDGSFKFKRKMCFAHRTKFGDGEYYDQIDGTYVVDSGCLGLVRDTSGDYDWDREMTEEEMDKDGMWRLGVFERFTKPFTVKVENGVFTFGHITIDTAEDNMTALIMNSLHESIKEKLKNKETSNVIA